jgi:membrane protein
MRAPWKLVRRVTVRSVQEFLDDHGPQLAAAISFHVLFSLFPLVILMAGIFGIVVTVSGVQADVVDTVVRNAPLSEEGEQDLRRLLEGATGELSALGLLALPGLLWSASGMMGAIRTALALAWDLEERRPFIRGKVVDVSLVLGTALVAVVSIGLTFAARVVEEIPGVAQLSALLVPLVLAFAVVLFLYRVVPARAPRLRDVWPAALFVAVVFVALQHLFAFYVENFGRYNAIYGSLGAVIAFLFFVYLSSNVFLLGAELGAELARVREDLGLEPDEKGEKGEMEPQGPDRGEPRAAPRARQRVGYGWAALVGGIAAALAVVLVIWLVL